MEGAGEPRPMVAHGMTHTGKRPRNEDCHLIREDLGFVIVADGFSGEAGGDIAARIAVDEIAGCLAQEDEQTLPCFEPHELSDGLTVATARFAIEHAHSSIRREAQRKGPPGMCTAVALLVVAGPAVIIGGAGSVHVYRFRRDSLVQLTRDEDMFGMNGRPVGAARDAARPAITTDLWRAGDRYLVCTSGLHRVLGGEMIRCTLSGCATAAECTAALIGRALHAGAVDNMTAVTALPWRHGAAPSPTPPERREMQ